ncbi:MAG TPA: ABC transporter permease [Bryobacteraceae bacterium]|nr:ABC transporter permease [Bryobacteraceae bacterium]
MASRLAIALLLAIAIASACANFIAPAGYEQQFRDQANAAPNGNFPLGTDELGRDRLARLLHGLRVSLLLAPATAALALCIAVVLGLTAGYVGGRADSLILTCTDLMGSVPLLFLLISLRAVLPLDVDPATSICITFSLLGFCGWAPGVRVVRSGVIAAASSDYVRQTRAAGLSPVSILRVHIRAALRPVISAQFWLLIPQFLMAEANLGALGLGITEPVPSVGNLLSELQNYTAVLQEPWRLVPAAVLIMVLGCFQVLLRESESTC